LEFLLTDQKTPIDKYSPNLIVPTSIIKEIKVLKLTLFILANNHTMDQGVQGLNSTINMLNAFKLPYIGASLNLREANKP